LRGASPFHARSGRNESGNRRRRRFVAASFPFHLHLAADDALEERKIKMSFILRGRRPVVGSSTLAILIY
jgi:hypothetical protein